MGIPDGPKLGAGVGTTVGNGAGAVVGEEIGTLEGCGAGTLEGAGIGKLEGCGAGTAVGVDADTMRPRIPTSATCSAGIPASPFSGSSCFAGGGGDSVFEVEGTA